jgi:hypothetical protein
MFFSVMYPVQQQHVYFNIIVLILLFVTSVSLFADVEGKTRLTASPMLPEY